MVAPLGEKLMKCDTLGELDSRFELETTDHEIEGVCERSTNSHIS